MPVQLRPEPQRLLEQLVEAEQRATERHLFTVYRWEGDGKVEIGIGHPGFPGNLLSPVFAGDLEILVHEGLLLRSGNDRQLSLSSAGYAYYDALKQGGLPMPDPSGLGLSSVVSFGAGTQMGDSHIRDVAGRDIVHIHLPPITGAVHEDEPELLPEQQRLLCEMVEAARTVLPDTREKFLFAWLKGGDRTVVRLLRHPGLPNETRTNVYEGDLEALARAGLLTLSAPRERAGQGGRDVDITNRGYTYYDALRARENDASSA